MTAAFFNFAAQDTLKVIAAGTWEHAGFQSIGIIVSNQAYAAGLKGFKDMAGHTVGITQLGTPLQYYFLQLAAKYHVPEARSGSCRCNRTASSPRRSPAVRPTSPCRPRRRSRRSSRRATASWPGWTADELAPRQGEAVFTATKTANDRSAIVKAYLAGLRAGDNLPRRADRARR